MTLYVAWYLEAVTYPTLQTKLEADRKTLALLPTLRMSVCYSQLIFNQNGITL